MMANMAENQPPAQPPGEPPTPPAGLPAIPAGAPPSPLPPGLDADEYRRFQEFQRFQDYQRFVQAQQGGTQPGSAQPDVTQPGTAQPGSRPTPYPSPASYQGWPGGPAPLPPGKPPRPPIWLIILRTKLVRRLITLGVVVLLLYIAYEHFFGTGDTNNPAALHPGPVQGSGRLATNPADAVAAVYHLIGENSPTNACLEFSAAGRAQFARDLGATTCAAAVTTIYGQLDSTGRQAYNEVLVPSTAVTTRGTAAEVSSCGMSVAAGPRLGVFVVTEDRFQGWQVTGHRSEPNPCPAPPTTTVSAPPTS
jgi:hypothetical protein